jgi:hypothetical protein
MPSADESNVQLAGRLKPSFISNALQNVDTLDMDDDLDKRIQHVATIIVAGKCSFLLPTLQA